MADQHARFSWCSTHSKSFLIILPLELRSQVFRHVFTGTSGYVYLEPTAVVSPTRFRIRDHYTTGNGSLPALRTCRQMYDECKDLLWKYNILWDQSTYPLAILPTQVKNKVRSFELRWGCLDGELYRNCFPLQLDLQELRTWPNLQSLSINADATIMSDGPWLNDDVMHTFRTWSHHDSFFQAQLEILREAGGKPSEETGAKRGYLSHLVRKIRFWSGDSVWSLTGKGGPLRYLDESEGDPNKMLTDIACAFGGTVQVDGITHYKDGDAIMNAFLRVSSEETQPAKFYYLTEMNAWKIATAYVGLLGGDVADVACTLAGGDHANLDLLRAPFSILFPMSDEKRVDLIRQSIMQGLMPNGLLPDFTGGDYRNILLGTSPKVPSPNHDQELGL